MFFHFPCNDYAHVFWCNDTQKILTNTISLWKYLLIKLQRSLASSLLVKPSCSASCVRAADGGAAGLDPLVFFFCFKKCLFTDLFHCYGVGFSFKLTKKNISQKLPVYKTIWNGGNQLFFGHYAWKWDDTGSPSTQLLPCCSGPSQFP